MHDPRQITPLSSDELASVALNYVAALGQLEESFFARPDGLHAITRRAALVDALVRELFRRHFEPATPLAVCAVGGYGRSELFPSSDVDLLFLVETPPTPELARALKAFLQSLWDAHLRASHSVHTLAETGTLLDGNAEFTISLLDVRPLAGQDAFTEQLVSATLPGLIRRERKALLGQLRGLVTARHAKYADTVYHLEPNIKDTPGALRDLQAMGWWQAIVDTAENLPPPAARWPGTQREALREAHGFLAGIRTFLHYLNGRDVNQFSYDMQERLSTEARWQGVHQPPELWMRQYFSHARLVHQRLRRTLERAPASPSVATTGRRFRLWRGSERPATAESHPDFRVRGAEVEFLEPERLGHEPELALALFTFCAERRCIPSEAAEQQVATAPLALAQRLAEPVRAWSLLRPLLLAPHCYATLTGLHDAGLLTALVPEFAAISALVQRDFYHRYTVDEHTLLTLKHLHGLVSSSDPTRQRFAELYRELEQPAALVTALLLHDVGKGVPGGDHVTTGLELAESALRRWAVERPVRDGVLFLIRNHLLLSQALRRDVFDPENVRQMAAITATEDRLKMLTLLTLVDIQSVHPDALTAWKQDNLWQLYIAVYNELTHNLDRDRIGVDASADPLQTARQLLADADGQKLGTEAGALAAFLAGLPRRYLVTCPPGAIVEHFHAAGRLPPGGARSLLEAHPEGYELTIIAQDRPGLFATITGILSGYGVNILKAEAFANQAGLVLDRFRFVDLHQTFELNPGELERFQSKIEEQLRQPPNLERLRAPAHKWFARRAGPEVETRIAFDTVSAGRQTLLEIVTRDRPGLLFDISRVLTEQSCDLSVALIDTEATKAIDVFYITQGGAPLSREAQSALQSALAAAL